MLNYIWCGIILLSIIFSIINGTTSELSNAVLNSASDSAELIVTMCGTVCLWSGIMAIADKSGASEKLAKGLSPILSKLFPDIPRESSAFKAICSNITANLLGLGNAATPLGLKAMREMSELNGKSNSASRSMIMFVILNTTSIQLMPTMILSLLNSDGCKNPESIIPCVWISSVFGLVIGIMSVYIFSAGKQKYNK